MRKGILNVSDRISYHQQFDINSSVRKQGMINTLEKDFKWFGQEVLVRVLDVTKCKLKIFNMWP